MEDNRLRVIEDESGDLFIEWDDDHQFASIFEKWSEEDWIEAIRLGSERMKEADNG